MSVNTQILNNLRDIHLPTGISWWPPTPAWFILALLVISASIFLTHHLWRYWQKSTVNKTALQQLALLRQKQQEIPPTELAANITILLRRVALTHYVKADITALHGHTWLDFLDNTGNTRAFSQHKHLLLKVPYKKNTKNDVTILFALAENWIKNHV